MGVSVVEDVQRALEHVHTELYNKALMERDARIARVDEWSDFSPNLNEGMLVLVPFCGEEVCEDQIKEKTKAEAACKETVGGLKMGAKSLYVPHEDTFCISSPSRCINPDCTASELVERRTLFGRSY